VEGAQVARRATWLLLLVRVVHLLVITGNSLSDLVFLVVLYLSIDAKRDLRNAFAM
jgi:hypothetical protein